MSNGQLTSRHGISTAWDDEYRRRGIPSSHREEPSGVVVWAMANLRYASAAPVRTALDLGCGTGRNARAMAAAGLLVTAMDFSSTALELATARANPDGVSYVEGDVLRPLPARTASCDLVTDIFVYFHQLDEVARRSYRAEIRRVLSADGILVVSLATSDDGYYGGCPPLESPATGGIELRWDPIARVGNILPTLQQFLDEMSDHFELAMVWQKRKAGFMHGKEYVRSTTATMWKLAGRSA